MNPDLLPDLLKEELKEKVRESPMPAWLGGNEVSCAEVVIRGKTPQEVYSFVRHVANFPLFMDGLVHVEELTGGEMRWVGRGDGEEWETEIVDDRAPCLLSWRSPEDVAFPRGGAITFRPSASGTEVHYRAAYISLAGKAIGFAEKIRGHDPERDGQQDLLRLKELLEKGETVAG